MRSCLFTLLVPFPFCVVSHSTNTQPLPQIVTERLTISSTTLPPTEPYAYLPAPTKPRAPTPAHAPSYELTVSFVRSASGGKSLLSRGRSSVGRSYTAFFDDKGVLDQEKFEAWVGGAVRDVMEGEKKGQ